jgi:hypothetical protein
VILLDGPPTIWIPVVILELIHARKLLRKLYLLDTKTKPSGSLVIHNNWSDRTELFDLSFNTLPYQLSLVVSWTTKALTGNGESGFDSGEGA